MTFKPGKSGNPAGRPRGVPNKVSRGVREKFAAKTDNALRALLAVVDDDEAPHAARVSAACAILDRAHGKPVQMTEHSGIDGERLALEVRFVGGQH